MQDKDYNTLINEGKIKDSIKNFLDDEEKMKYIEKAGKVGKSVGNIAGAVAAIGGATAAVHKGYKYIKKRNEKKKLEKKKAEEVKNEDIEIYNLIGEGLDLLVFLDEDGDISFMEEEINQFLECYEIEEEDLYDMIYSENSDIEIFELSEGLWDSLKAGVSKYKGKAKKVASNALSKTKEVASDTVEKTKEKAKEINAKRPSQKVKKLEADVANLQDQLKQKMISDEEASRKLNRILTVSAALGVTIAGAIGIKKLLKNRKDKKEGKKKALKESTELALLSIDSESLLEARDIDAYIEELENRFEPFMELVQLDENTVVDVYFTESGVFINEDEIDLILENNSDLTEEDIYDVIYESLKNR